MAGAAAPDQHVLDLGHGLALRCSMPSLDGAVRVAIAFHDRELFSQVFRPHSPPHAVRHAGEHLDVSLELAVDAFAGEVRAGGHLKVRAPLLPRWRSVIDADDDVLLRFSPGVGQVGDSSTVQEPLVIDERFGRSQLCTPAVLRIFVTDEDREVSRSGALAKRKLFADLPPFVFNTVACVGQAEGPDRLGLYTNPASHWFNVFFGYYQLDAAKADWPRPFGYRTADGVRSEVAVEDVVRLGKSDWNFFSNWNYGVPAEVVDRYTRVDPAAMPVRQRPPERIGDSLWHPLTIDSVEVASTYESDAADAQRLVDNTILAGVWRDSFGMPNPQPGFSESFVATKLRASMWVAYWEDAEAFHTTIFGGTLTEGTPDDFLALQLDAVRTVMERSYPRLGFPPTG
jgi:hypothetical protein